MIKDPILLLDGLCGGRYNSAPTDKTIDLFCIHTKKVSSSTIGRETDEWVCSDAEAKTCRVWKSSTKKNVSDKHNMMAIVR